MQAPEDCSSKILLHHLLLTALIVWLSSIASRSTSIVPSTMATSSVAGLWNRLTEEDPIGDTANADRDTTVLWTQSKESGIYVDIRLPKDSPGLSLEAAKDIAKRPSALAGSIDRKLLPYLDVLMRHKSFAGVLDVKPGDTTAGNAIFNDPTLKKLVDDPKAIIPLCTCFWRRDIDFQPPTGGLDIGVCASAATADENLWLRETGADADYAEDWSRPESTTKGPFMVLQLVDGDRMGFWVRAAERFAYAVGRTTNEEKGGLSARVHKCVGKSLAEATQELASSDEERLDMVGSYVCVVGLINDKNEWVIHRSINPELVGCVLAGDSALSCSRLEKEGDTNVVQTIRTVDGNELKRTWKIVEMSPQCALPLS